MIGGGDVKKICGCVDGYCKCDAASNAINEEEHKRKLRFEIKQLFGRNFSSSKTTNKKSGQRHDNRYYLNLVDLFSGIIYKVTNSFKKKRIGTTKKKQIKQMMDNMVKEIPYSLKSDDEIYEHLEKLNEMLDSFTTQIYYYLNDDDKKILKDIEDMKRYIKRAKDHAFRNRLELDLKTMDDILQDILRTINEESPYLLYLESDKNVKMHLNNVDNHIKRAMENSNESRKQYYNY